MATSISGSKVFNQMFKCFNCGRKSVSLQNDFLLHKSPLLNSIDDEDEDLEDNEFLDDLKDLGDEWLATCRHCGWSDT